MTPRDVTMTARGVNMTARDVTMTTHEDRATSAEKKVPIQSISPFKRSRVDYFKRRT